MEPRGHLHKCECCGLTYFCYQEEEACKLAKLMNPVDFVFICDRCEWPNPEVDYLGEF